MKNIKIIIATHKKYNMPEDDIYIPLHVGAKGKSGIGYKRDDTGENISEKNAGFCELTGLYWAWKNLNCSFLGLVHYRRHFSYKKKGSLWKSVLTTCQAEKLCGKYDIILPKKRKYYIETLYSHYVHTHYVEHLIETRKILKDKYPEYLVYFDRVMKQKSGFMFNMYIMKKELSDEYCEWLFDILFELESRVNMPYLSKYQGRFYGRVSELLFNVWLAAYLQVHTDKNVKEISYICMERVNWLKKGTSFLKAKFLKKKYKESF